MKALKVMQMIQVETGVCKWKLIKNFLMNATWKSPIIQVSNVHANERFEHEFKG